MDADTPHRPLCTIELIATGRAHRCPGAECPYWENGCALARVESDLARRQDVAGLLLEVRRQLEAAQTQTREDALADFHRRLSAGRE